uniref:Geranylgeranyl transferase type-2 subunit alpha n=1 Tax=Hirondellea gigas TaxID=1518452 RepID=A0A2P2HYN5_9CRUS
MHGRLKVKDSAEKAAEKSREREKKRKKYLAGINLLFEKRELCIHDSESLQVSALLLQANPDALTLWNSRRETILALRDKYKKKSEQQALNEDDESTTENSKVSTAEEATPTSDVSATASTVEEATETPDKSPSSISGIVYPPLPTTWEELLVSELGVVSACLQHNHKSYGAWHHRTWVMRQLCEGAEQKQQQQAWDSELNLCNLFLTKDERNFHCWDYRRHVVAKGGVAAEKELHYSLELIERNLSNFSAWHYRAKLLPLLHPPHQGSPHPVGDHVFKQELERVVEAVFTDPSDQSPWFFLRWLLQRQPQHPRATVCGVRRVGEQRAVLVCSFSSSVAAAALPPLPVLWTSSTGQKYSKVWSAVLSISKEDEEFEVSLEFPDGPSFAKLRVPSDTGDVASTWMSDPRPAAMSSPSVETLEQLRENCTMLDDVDPNNKWVLLTLVEVLWSLSGSVHRKRAQQILTQLTELDPLRAGYYADCKSKLSIEELTQEYASTCFDASSSSDGASTACMFDGSKRCLTRVDGLEMLCCCSHVNLSHNNLVNIASLCQLQLCSELLLDSNSSITSLAALATLPCLRYLSLNDCSLPSTDVLQPLLAISTLERLSLKGNFLDESEKQIVKKLFWHLECVEL